MPIRISEMAGGAAVERRLFSSKSEENDSPRAPAAIALPLATGTHRLCDTHTACAAV